MAQVKVRIKRGSLVLPDGAEPQPVIELEAGERIIGIEIFPQPQDQAGAGERAWGFRATIEGAM